jgi:hypothetical protein
VLTPLGDSSIDLDFIELSGRRSLRCESSVILSLELRNKIVRDLNIRRLLEYVKCIKLILLLVITFTLTISEEI